MDYLVNSLVQVPKRSPTLTFEDQLEEVLSQAEIIFRDDFHSDVEIELAPENGGSPVFLEFSYFLSGPRPVSFRTLLFKGRTSKLVEKNVAAIISTLDQANRIGFLDRNYCVVLCDKFGEAQQHNHRAAFRIGARLDASDNSTARDIHGIVYSS